MLAAEGLDFRDLIFVDEFAANLDMSRPCGRALPGERVVERKPVNTPVNTSVVAALGIGEVVTSLCLEGAFDGESFCLFVEQGLCPLLKPGQIVLIDNGPIHKPRRVEEAIEAVGAHLIYLPAYSPDFNPIEEAFSKIKGHLKSAAARTREALDQALAKALKLITPKDIRGWFEHAGYRFTFE